MSIVLALACALIVTIATGAALPIAVVVFVASALLIPTAGRLGLLAGGGAMSESP
jgi:hypothetical protein